MDLTGLTGKLYAEPSLKSGGSFPFSFKVLSQHDNRLWNVDLRSASGAHFVDCLPLLESFYSIDAVTLPVLACPGCGQAAYLGRDYICWKCRSQL